MEVEKRKRNKRVIREDVVQEEEEEEESDRLKKSKGEEAAAAGAGGSSGVPTEEEVEEFFAILRRMKVAVKYFDEKGKVGGGCKEWREALETADVTVDDGELGGVFDDKKKGGKLMINEGLDLNVVAPEASETGGE